MNCIELYVVSSFENVEFYGPTFYRSNKHLMIINDLDGHKSYKGNICYYTNSLKLLKYNIEVNDNNIFVKLENKELKITIEPKDFAVKIMLPIESQMNAMDLISYQDLKYIHLESLKMEVEVGLDAKECKDTCVEADEDTEPLLSDEEELVLKIESRKVLSQTSLISNTEKDLQEEEEEEEEEDTLDIDNTLDD